MFEGAYLSARYLDSLRFYAEPLALPQSGGWLLKRPLTSPGLADLCGPYPIFRCQDWSGLAADLAELESDPRLVSLVLVTDALDPPPLSLLESLFPHRCSLFKSHYLVDCSQPLSFSSHHRYWTRRSLRQLTVRLLTDPVAALPRWCQLYETLKTKHGISGLRSFSPTAFALQLQAPGIYAFEALLEDETVGMVLWYADPSLARVYNHLSALSERGYQLFAGFALYAEAIRWFQEQGARWIDLGGGVHTGLQPQAGHSGLERFKSGWSNARQAVWLCGRILNPARYAQLSAGRKTHYFPAYREGEQP